MTGANVQSIDALQDWHSALAVFREEALESLAAVALEIQRADAWLDDQLRGWQNEARDAEEEVAQCKAELANRKFVGFDGRVPDCSVQEENLWRAEDRLERAREQIEVVRRWYHKLPKLVSEEYEVSARHMLNMLEGDVPRALAAIKNQIASLEAYANLRAEQFAPSPANTAARKESP